LDGPDTSAKSVSSPPYSARVTERKTECVCVDVGFISLTEFIETTHGVSLKDVIKAIVSEVEDIFSGWKCKIV